MTGGRLDQPVEVLRRMHDTSMAKLPRSPVDRVGDLPVPGIPARLYRPAGVTPLPVLVFLHGGGWVMGGVESYDPIVRALTVACRVAFVSVEYRRPPEHPHPAAVEDAETVLRWVAAHATGYGLDPTRLGVAGDSGGAQIAMAAALRLARTGGPALALQLLAYPVVDLREDTPYATFRPELRQLLDLYLGPADRTDPRVSPLLAADLDRLPATIVAIAEHDYLRPQGEELVRRLRAAGTDVHCLDGSGLDHGFLGWGSLARRPAEAIADLGLRVRRRLGVAATGHSTDHPSG